MKTILKIVRFEHTTEGAVGVLLFKDKFFCFTLQPDIDDPN